MSFNKKYPNRKDYRKQYTKKAERVDSSCRPGGDCPRCSMGRQHNSIVKEFDADDEIDEFLSNHHWWYYADISIENLVDYYET